MNTLEKKNGFYAVFSRKITPKVIDRAYENHPYPNADGTIDYYKKYMGEWEDLCGFPTTSYEMAVEYVQAYYPTIIKVDDWKVTLKPVPKQA